MSHTTKASLLGLFVAGAAAVQAQHIEAGALGTTQGSQLYFENGASFVAGSGYTQPMNLATTGRTTGYPTASGPTFTALSRLGDLDVASPNAAALGSFLELGIVSVSGPTGGAFQFWEGTSYGGGTTPTIRFPVGYSVGTPTLTWNLSDPATAGDAGEDPFGHLHGRRFTATGAVGSYTVGFQIVDTSSNGAGGGPIHSPSETFFLTYSAVPEPSEYAALAGAALVGFAVWRRRQTA